MRFDEQLNRYIEEIGCTTRELAQAGGLSASTVSRYRTGERTPRTDSDLLTRLARGISRLAEKKFSENDPDMRSRYAEDEILRRLRAPLMRDIPEDYERYLSNLSTLMDILGVKHINIARSLHMDPSYVSRILSGKRRPTDTMWFAGEVVSYIVKNRTNETELATLASLYGCAPEELSDPHKLRERTVQWLGSGNTSVIDSSVQSFLDKLNAFDLNDFMRSIRFDEINTPTPPFQMPDSKLYYGISEMMQAELDFLKSAVLSESTEDVIFYSDMPLEDMSKDPEFPKKWMLEMAMLLRKGLRLINIHDVHRPLPEMMLGLEAWIPMYMTGQISPYYLREQTNHTFMHFIRSAGTVAVAGEAIAGKQDNGRYLVTKKREDVEYYRRRAEDLLRRSLPLMHIFRKEQETGFYDQMAKFQKGRREYRFICGAPPLFTMPEDLLRRILERNKVGTDEAEKILRFCRDMKGLAEKDAESIWSLELPQRGENGSVRLGLSWLFPSADICYTGEEYLEHLRATETYAAAHTGVILSVNSYAVFRNIDIIICKNRYVLISKCSQPTIHFVIYHPKIVKAFEEFTPPLCF